MIFGRLGDDECCSSKGEGGWLAWLGRNGLPCLLLLQQWASLPACLRTLADKFTLNGPFLEDLPTVDILFVVPLMMMAMPLRGQVFS